jgi:hypothetical protein
MTGKRTPWWAVSISLGGQKALRWRGSGGATRSLEYKIRGRGVGGVVDYSSKQGGKEVWSGAVEKVMLRRAPSWGSKLGAGLQDGKQMASDGGKGRFREIECDEERETLKALPPGNKGLGGAQQQKL